jgi:uncharacterized protein YbjQ (UPF0145 family)
VIISTMNDLPGYEVEEAESKGAKAIGGFCFDTSELGTTWTKICAYGAAVKAREL